ncbi:hypothetical protein CSW67_27610, partial [Shigella boydii]|uniref:hypothetical protein n=1 Tax=Shigella boydii TaxID=621 RepID=UPI000C10BCDC
AENKQRNGQIRPSLLEHDNDQSSMNGMTNTGNCGVAENKQRNGQIRPSLLEHDNDQSSMNGMTNTGN